MSPLQPLPPMSQPYPMRSETFGNGIDIVDGNDAWALMTACAAGDGESVNRLIAKDPRLVNAEFWYQFPLDYAVRANRVDIVQALIDAGAEMGRQRWAHGPSGNSWQGLLDVAALRGYDDIKACLEATMAQRYNYDPAFNEITAAFEAQDWDRIHAVLSERPELARGTDAFANSGIHWAVLMRQLPLIDVFLDHGADINGLRTDGKSPLILAVHGWSYGCHTPETTIRERHVITGYLLARGADYVFSAAVALGDEARVKALLTEDPTHARRLDTHGMSPLKYAAEKGHSHLVRRLLDHGADPNLAETLSSPNGAALHAASAEGHLETAEMLLEAGANPNAYVDSSGSCLTTVKHGGHPDGGEAMTALLTRYGATPTATPWALETEDFKTLVKTDPHLLDEAQFVLSMASSMDEELADLALAAKPDVFRGWNAGDEFISGIAPSSAAMLKKMLDHGLDPHAPNYMGATHLHLCAWRNEPDIAALLLEAGANVNALDFEHHATPLAFAAIRGHGDMVDYLLTQGADPHIPEDGPWAQPSACAEREGHDVVVNRFQGK